MTQRASNLPVLQYCGASARLSLGAGMSARQSTAWHAMQAKSDRAPSLLALLSPEELEEVLRWGTPDPLELSGLAPLHYHDALHELALGLTADGQTVAHADPKAMVNGTLDMAWSGLIYEGEDAVVVGDLKKSRFSSSGPHSLQLRAYLFMLAGRPSVDPNGVPLPLPRWGNTALWIGEERRWSVGEWLDLASIKAVREWEKIAAAAENGEFGEFTTGPHCHTDCYARLRCPAHMVELGEGKFAIPGTKLDPETATPEQVADLARAWEAERKPLEAAEEFLRAWVRRNGGISIDGRVLDYSPTKGRESVMGVAECRRLLGADAEKVIRPPTPTSQFRWKKADE